MGNLPAAEAVQASVVVAAIAGDTMAFARIVRAHHDDMARVCQVVCGDPDLAQDAAQAAWPIAWRKLGSLREHDRLRPWLVSIAANEARKMVQRQHRDRVVAIEVADVGSDTHDPATRAGATDLMTAVRRLPADDRTLLALRYVAGFDATEIGQALGMSPSGVRTKLSRLIARLRKDMDDV